MRPPRVITVWPWEGLAFGLLAIHGDTDRDEKKVGDLPAKIMTSAMVIAAITLKVTHAAG